LANVWLALCPVVPPPSLKLHWKFVVGQAKLYVPKGRRVKRMLSAGLQVPKLLVHPEELPIKPT